MRINNERRSLQNIASGIPTLYAGPTLFNIF